MLIEFFGKNFGCFRDEFRLSMEATDIDPDNPRGVMEVPIKGSDKPLRLLRCVAIYGPNASGKSTILDAAAALHMLVNSATFLRSDDEIELARPFAFGHFSSNPCELGARWCHDGECFGYEVAFDRKRVTMERLTRHTAIHGETVLFERNGGALLGEWLSDPQFELISRAVSPNTLVLSLADRLAPALPKAAVQLGNLLEPFLVGPALEVAHKHLEYSLENAGFAAWLESQLQESDLGVCGFQVERLPATINRTTDTSSRRLSRMMSRATNLRHLSAIHFPSDVSVTLLHRFGDERISLPLEHESAGTIEMLRTGFLVYQLLTNQEPACAFFDEWGESLHPLLFKRLIEQLNSSSPDRKGVGQLVFSTHQSSLLEGPAQNATLRRDQIYITKKKADGSAELFSVADFDERQNLNIRKRYEEGRYGGIPIVGPLPEAW